MHITVGILAHVDAGKTTFSEQVLYHTGVIRRRGRVDHADSFFDLNPIEQRRGITVFSDQAYFPLNGDTVHWLDTPGHVDFSAEMERSARAMDVAVLLLSAAEGVQSHTETVWNLLRRLNVPTLLFINKTDRAGADVERVLAQMHSRLGEMCVDFRKPDPEQVAQTDESLMELFFEGEVNSPAWNAACRRAFQAGRLCPVYAGSALNDVGVAEFLDAMSGWIRDFRDDDAADGPFRGLVYKVRYDDRNARVAYVKVLQGRLKARDEVATPEGDTGKLTDVRFYRGKRFEPGEAQAGDIVGVVGLSGVQAGDVVGAEPQRTEYEIQPMLTAMPVPEGDVSPTQLLAAFRRLEDEDPQLMVEWDERLRMLTVYVMGRIQLEVLTEVLRERFGISVRFEKCRVRYLETVAAPVLGVGHYEPLRHYAEVHLAILPAPRGSGVHFRSVAHVDEFPAVHQRLIETHVFERRHPGVLTGAPLTDVEIVLTAGRFHLKHTEGGDFRQATYRAIRQGLMKAECVLLEPVCAFELSAPESVKGRIMGDLNRMGADVASAEEKDGLYCVSGSVPAARMIDYAADFPSVTHGRGALSFRLDHYAPVENQQAVVAEIGYDPEADRENTPNSVFCQKGAGYEVDWRACDGAMHLPLADPNRL